MPKDVAVAANTTPSHTLFGWCMEPHQHDKCRVSFTSNGRKHVCTCPEHKDSNG